MDALLVGRRKALVIADHVHFKELRMELKDLRAVMHIEFAVSSRSLHANKQFNIIDLNKTNLDHLCPHMRSFLSSALKSPEK